MSTGAVERTPAKYDASADESTRTSASGERQLVVFTLGNQEYGVDIGTVREIIMMQAVTKLPRTATFIIGLINLRGKVIPIVDLCQKFNVESAESKTDEEMSERRIIVVDIKGQDIGVAVDTVTEVLRVPVSCLEPPSAIVGIQQCDYLLGIAKLSSRLIILVDLRKVLSETEERHLADIVV
jgi:purine-binding chemotaxis protein CheW